VQPILAAASAAGVPVRLVHAPQLRDRLGADLVLVRPDQHVAWRGSAADASDPADLLARVTGLIPLEARS
jgi:hypothetical protein